MTCQCLSGFPSNDHEPGRGLMGSLAGESNRLLIASVQRVGFRLRVPPACPLPARTASPPREPPTLPCRLAQAAT